MRAFELLLEKNLSASDFYKKSRLDSFISKLEKKEPFIVDRQEQVIDVTPQELAKLKDFYKFYNEIGDARKVDATANIPKVIGGVPLSKIAKTGEFGGKGAYNVEKANIGPAVEVIKAAAIFAKLSDRTDSPVTLDTIKDLLTTVKGNVSLQKGAKSKVETFQGSISKEVTDKKAGVTDTINLVVAANEGSFLRAIGFAETDRELMGSVNGILKYVNTDPEMARYNRYFSQNARKDSVNISIVGGQGKKTDVKTTYIDPTTGEERTLKSLSMSLKAGKGATLDQAPGTNVGGVRKFFDILGFDTTAADQAIAQSGYTDKQRGEPLEALQKRKEAAGKIMQIAAQQLNQKYFAKNDQGEALFVDEFLKNLTRSMTKDEKLIYVEFNANGTYNKLNPRRIMDLAKTVDLSANPQVSPTGVSYIYIVDKISGKSLFHIRLLVSKAERIAFFFEIDDLIPLVMDASSKIRTAL